MREVSEDSARRILDAALRSSLPLFIRRVFQTVSPADDYQHNWHIDCIAEHLLAVESGEIKRLIVNIPPRFMKSICVSVAFPAWLLGQNPSTRVIAASYSQSLSDKLSMDSRLVVESEWYKRVFPSTVMAADQNQKGFFMTDQRGFRRSTSTGGSILGEGGDYLIADDLVKADEASSDTMREYANTWFDQSFMTRMNQPRESKCVVVMQRLHQQDLTGHLIEKGGWHLLKIPSEARRKVYIELGAKSWKMEEGDVLHQGRMGLDELRQSENDLGALAYAGQFLQEPAPDGGAEFKVSWYNFYERINDYSNLNPYMIVDPAGDKKKKTSDFTAIRVWGLGGDNNYYLIGTVRDRLNTTERVKKIFELQRKFSKLCGKPVVVFYKSRSFITEFHAIKEKMAAETYHFPLIEVVEKGSKNDRIRRMIPTCQQMRMWLPATYSYVDHTQKNRDLTKDFLDNEVALFPVSAHDDMLDADSELFNEELAPMISFPSIWAYVPANEPRNIWDV